MRRYKNLILDSGQTKQHTGIHYVQYSVYLFFSKITLLYKVERLTI